MVVSGILDNVDPGVTDQIRSVSLGVSGVSANVEQPSW
jgi:hypothetical protein